MKLLSRRLDSVDEAAKVLAQGADPISMAPETA
jgi:hypothetical protein